MSRIRREIIYAYRWASQFWPWHRRSDFIVRWGARRFMMEPWTICGTYKYRYTFYRASDGCVLRESKE